VRISHHEKWRFKFFSSCVHHACTFLIPQSFQYFYNIIFVSWTFSVYLTLCFLFKTGPFLPNPIPSILTFHLLGFQFAIINSTPHSLNYLNLLKHSFQSCQVLKKPLPAACWPVPGWTSVPSHVSHPRITTPHYHSSLPWRSQLPATWVGSLPLALELLYFYFTTLLVDHWLH
jgi:hypothetical protein